MDFRDILGQLHGIIDEGKMADIKGKKHTGKYGTDHDTDEEGEEKKRGGQESDATKDSKKWQGAADAAKLISGGKKSSLKDWVESTEEAIMERAKNKYAIGMAAAEKMTGDTPPLKKSTIKKAHEIAKGIKEEDVTEDRKDDTNFGSTVTKGSWVVYDGSKVKRFKSRDSAKTYAEKNGGKVASSEFYADNIQKQDVTEELKGGQKKIDKNKNGKLDAQDFKMLRKEKIKEGVNFQEMMTEKQRKVDEMLEELQQEIAEFKATGNMGDKLRDALDIHSYTKDETLIGEETDSIGDEIRHGQDVQLDKDMARSDLYHTQDMSRMGDEGRADARHMKDVADLRDQSTSDLWRIKNLARDKSMAKSELEENPFSYAAKQAKANHEDTFSLGGKTFPVKESDEPRLKTTKTDAGSETTSTTGRLKATFEPGKETKVEPVKEASKSYTDDMGPASGYTDEEMKAMDRQVAKAQEANRKESERQAKNVWDPSMGSPKTPGDPVGLPKKSVKESMAYDVWNHQIEKMINESLTVSTTQNDTGDDSVSVTASGEDAADIMALLRNAGIGGMGPTEHQEEPEQQFSNYGVPISAEHHDAGIANHGKPSVEVISAGDEMGELMQALSSIASEENSDYADEEVDEGNAFTGALHDTPKGGEFEVGGNKYTDHSSLEEEMCQECGVYESGCGCDKGHEMIEEEDEDDDDDAAPAGATAPAGQAAMSYAGNQAGASSAPAAAPAASTGPAASNAAMSALTGGASVPKGDTTAAMPSSQVAATAPAASGNMKNAADVMRGGQVGNQPAAAPSTMKNAADVMRGGQATKTAAAPAAQQAAMPASQTTAARVNPAAAGAGLNKAPVQAKPAAKPGGYSATGMVGTDFEESVEENLESARPIEEELANGADDRATQDIDFMTRVISGGLNKEKVQHKNGYQFADNPLAMKESKVYSANDLLHDYRKLSGLE